MPHSFIFVISGNYAEAEEWAGRVGLMSHQWKYVFNANTVRGKWSSHKFAAVGSYRDRPDYLRLRALVRAVGPNFAQGWEFK